MTTTGARQSVAARWPALPIRGRVLPSDLASSSPKFQGNASPPTPSYSVAPSTLATLLDVLAALSAAGAVALVAWQALVIIRRRPARRLDPLERALRLAREAESQPVPHRRRAVGLLARLLGRDRLSSRANDLAWSEHNPEPDELEALVSEIERRTPAMSSEAIPLADARNLRSYAPRHDHRHRGACSRRRRLCGRVCARRAEPAHTDDLGVAASCRRRGRARCLGEHLLRHVLANRRDAENAVSQRRPVRSDRLLERRVRGAAARNAGRGSSAVRALFHAAAPAHPRLPALVSAQPLDEHVYVGHQYLDRHASRERDRLRTTSAADDRARQRSGRRPWRHPGAHADPPERPSQEGADTRHRPQSDAE